MRIAICVSGHLRNLSEDNQLVALIKKTSADVFISTWNDIEATSAYDRFFPSASIAELIIGLDENQKYNYDIKKFKRNYPALHKLFYDNKKIDKDLVTSLIPNIKAIHIEESIIDFEINRTLNGITYPADLLDAMPERYMFSLPMFYKIHDSNELKKNYESQNNFKYDIVIRARTDIDFNNLEEIISSVKREHSDNEISTIADESSLNDELFLSDIFAIGSSRSMDDYAEIFTMLSDYWNLAKHPNLAYSKRSAERLLGYHVKFIKNITCNSINSKALVSTSVARKKVGEVFPAFMIDITAKPTLSSGESKAHMLMANLYYKEKMISADLPSKENILKAPIEKVWLLASIAKSHNDLITALPLYEKAHLYLKDHDARPTIDYALTLSKLGNLDKALEALLSASIKNNKDHIFLRHIGTTYHQIAKSCAQDKKHFYLNLAWIYLQQSCKLGNFSNEITLRASIEVCNTLNNTMEVNDLTKKIETLTMKKNGMQN
ncbi:hypothetical protein [Pseudomonas putida]|jgi:hypothetical protein|uniref:hypothetical protein n=1 Tax=Pseudomonas putida TaxID=303 RepID=UPI00098196AA|nr:hypothetical protein [Pseudomonas putida]OMQ37093.1 hypothetical protein BKX96_11390 [Pseudomonas putida]